MSQQTFSPGGTQVAEPPAPVLPMGDTAGGDDNRRKLMMVGAAVGVLVIALVGYFLMKGGSTSSSDSSFVRPHHVRHAAPAAAQPPAVKLPKHVAAPVGRDPFKALYVAPAAVAGTGTSSGSTAPSQTSTGPTTTPTTSGGTTTTTTTAPTYHPVWIQLRSVTTATASFAVGYSNGKTLKAIAYDGVKPLHTFASGKFELLSVHNGVVSLKFGDGSPFQLDRSHNTMVVD